MSASYTVCWEEFELGLKRLDTYYARGGEVFDAFFVVHLTGRNLLPNVRDLNLKYVRCVTVLFSNDCGRADGERFYLFGTVVLALLELFVASAVRGVACTIVGFENWHEHMLPCAPTRWPWWLGSLKRDLAGRYCRYGVSAPRIRGHSSCSARVRDGLRTSFGATPSSVCAADSGPPYDSSSRRYLAPLPSRSR